MNEQWKDQVFEQLEPPPGGLTALRARMLRQDPKRERPALRFAMGCAAIVAATAVFMIILTTSRSQVANPDALEILTSSSGFAHPAFIAHGLDVAPTQTITVAPARRDTLAVAQVPSNNPNVELYWLSSTAPPIDSADGATPDE